MRAQRALLAMAALVAFGSGAIAAPTASGTSSSARFVLAVDSAQAPLDAFDATTTPSQISVSTGAGMPTSLRQWISGALAHDHAKKDGAVHTCSYDGKIVSTLNFKQGLISEIDFPPLDGASKDAARLTLKVTPESTTSAQGTGTASAPAAPSWLASNFKFTVDGIDTSHVSKVDSIVVKLPATGTADPVKLVVYTPQGQAPAFGVWARMSPGKTKNGHLDYLAPDQKTKLFGLRLSNLGTPTVTNTTVGTATMTKVEMAVGDIGLEP
jgi:hypothetical protein